MILLSLWNGKSEPLCRTAMLWPCLHHECYFNTLPLRHGHELQIFGFHKTQLILSGWRGWRETFTVPKVHVFEHCLEGRFRCEALALLIDNMQEDGKALGVRATLQ